MRTCLGRCEPPARQRALAVVHNARARRREFVRWFHTFAMNVSQIYDGDNQAAEMKIEPENEAAS